MNLRIGEKIVIQVHEVEGFEIMSVGAVVNGHGNYIDFLDDRSLEIAFEAAKHVLGSVREAAGTTAEVTKGEE